MDWNVRTPSLWDWDNPLPFDGGYKLSGGSGDGGVGGGGGGGSGGASSGSEFGNVSSSKSSISVSTDFSSKATKEASLFELEAYPNSYECLQGLGCSRAEVTAAAGPEEPLISLKLGKRTYFEDVPVESNANKAASPSAPISASSALVKKSRMPNQGPQSVCCQVEGCNVDLSSAKDYHRKHRVCEDHTKCPRVIVAGQERRFCQQCSRFHDLSEFDQKKRSCRRRLSDHNARRRKPQPDIISFNSSTFSFSAYDERQMNFLWNKAPNDHMRLGVSSTWEGTCDSKLPQTGEQWITKTEGVAGELHTSDMQLSNGFPTLYHEIDKLLPLKATTAEVLNRGSEVSVGASNLDGAPGLQRALSLLSSSSWVSPDSGHTSLMHLPASKVTNEAQSLAPSVTLIADDWHNGQSFPQQTRMLSFARENSNGHLDKLQLQKEPYGTSLLDSSQIY